MTDFNVLPAQSAVAITKSDSALIPVTRGVYVGGDGDLVAKMLDGKQVTFTGVVAGSVYPFRVTQVLNATTATNLVALY